MGTIGRELAGLFWCCCDCCHEEEDRDFLPPAVSLAPPSDPAPSAGKRPVIELPRPRAIDPRSAQPIDGSRFTPAAGALRSPPSGAGKPPSEEDTADDLVGFIPTMYHVPTVPMKESEGEFLEEGGAYYSRSGSDKAHLRTTSHVASSGPTSTEHMRLPQRPARPDRSLPIQSPRREDPEFSPFEYETALLLSEIAGFPKRVSWKDSHTLIEQQQTRLTHINTLVRTGVVRKEDVETLLSVRSEVLNFLESVRHVLGSNQVYIIPEEFHIPDRFQEYFRNRIEKRPYVAEKPFAQGGFGFVNRGHIGSHRLVVKHFEFLKREDRGSTEQLQRIREKRIQHALCEIGAHFSIPRSPHLLHCDRVHIEWTRGHKIEKISLILPEALGDLSTEIRAKKLSGDRFVPMAHQILQGLSALHNQPVTDYEGKERIGLAHLDLKPHNVLILNEDDKVAICDFGIASATGQKTRGKTIHYVAPEQLAFPDSANTASDIWAFGIVIFEVLSGGNVPFHSRFIMSEKFHSQRPVDILLQSITQVSRSRQVGELIEIMAQCLRINPDKRPTADDLLKNPLFTPSGLQETSRRVDAVAHRVFAREVGFRRDHFDEGGAAGGGGRAP